jgi:hypothetical protein
MMGWPSLKRPRVNSLREASGRILPLSIRCREIQLLAGGMTTSGRSDFFQIFGYLFIRDRLSDKGLHAVKLCAAFRAKHRPRHVFMLAICAYDHETYSFFGGALSKARVP